MKHITYQGLKQMIEKKEDFVLLNVQSAETFNKDHIPGSINIPWREIPIADRDNKIPKGKAVVVYCGSFTCDASAKGAEILDLLGYKVIQYDGGMKDWNDTKDASQNCGIDCQCD